MTLEIETDANGAAWVVLPYAEVDGSVAATKHKLDQVDAAGGVAVMGTRYRVPPSEGCGAIHVIRVSPRLYIMLFDVEYQTDREIQVPGDRMVKIRVLLSGALNAIGSDVAIEGAGAYLEAYPGDIASSYVLKGGINHRLVVLMCEPDFFTEDLRLAGEDLPQPLRYFFDFASGAPKASIMPLGPELLRAANDIMRSGAHYSGKLHRTYLNAKSQEVACAIVRELSRPLTENAALAKLSVRDVNRAHEARDILADQYRRPPSVPKLARQVGLNQTKLKIAFKAVFGLTLKDFTLQCRMERGSELLTTTSLSISEIAYAMGYDHPANFTHAFRRFHGCAPRQLRKATLGEIESHTAEARRDPAVP